MLVTPVINSPGIPGQMQVINPGDILNMKENVPVAVSGAANFTIANTDLAQADLAVSGGAGVNMTWPTAQSILDALRGNINVLSPPSNALYGSLPSQSVQTQWPANLQPFEPGTTFRRTVYNSNTGTLTSVTNTGITLAGTTTVITVNWREFLLTIKNSSPTQITQATTTNASAVLSNVDSTVIQSLTNGMLATGTGLGAAPNRIVAINRDALTVTLSVVATASANNIAVTFTPEIEVRGLLKSGTI
jgi:hypothetical protein